MSRSARITIADCSYQILIRIAKQCGFTLFEGRKHCKVKTRDGRFVTTIPRHNRVKRETARSIIDAMNASGASIRYS
ncbi:MAG: hypothetical protein A3A44_01230 [Candidatus Sungbacteria bacterium RIFCSPLOWO2_01_FULL_60_25]|uniref:Addiction module toxin, HicA family n=1 Tax=Candidatus Sungbacteria bacterium RIFCSPLOWO2_01_FULL_60_25 TaxID=1802281 RepID=A0A1G2LHB6_9BACT|nr:MAG: hypothetical protein A3A44_01230 [Candidatus Sungbacteria bacterium RIFCSPLOWO2_01_FULL_60_25]